MINHQEKVNKFVEYCLESFFDGAVNLEDKKTSPLDEINWNEPDIADTKSRCMTMDALKDWLNSELDRYKSGNKAAANMPRISRGNIVIGDQGSVDVQGFIKLLTTPPKTIFDKGEKSLHSVDENNTTINTGIPALRGVVWDEEHKEFRIVNTCPAAGACAVDCYAMQGFYIMNDGKNIKLAQRLQLIFQNPEQYIKQATYESESFAFDAKRNNKTLEIRWNDAGDFFSERYLKLALQVTKYLLEKQYPVKSYFYTKVGKMVDLGQKLGFTVTFSAGGIDKSPEAKKHSIVVPKDVFKQYLIPTKGRGYEKDTTGKSQFRDGLSKDSLRKTIFDTYHGQYTDLTIDSIKFTDELPKIEGKPGEFSAIVLPGGDTDAPAQRQDVKYIFLLKH